MHKRTSGKTPNLTMSGRIPPPKKRANRKRRDWNRVIRRWCAAALVLEAAVALLANPYLRVTRVRIEGLQTLSAERVFAEAQVPARTNIFLMALRQPFARRLTRDPVIEGASRAIELPHTLVLRVRERQPYATLAEGDSFWLLDRNGVPFRALEAPPPQVPVLEIQGAAPPLAVTLGRPLKSSYVREAYRLMDLVADKKILSVMKIKVDQNANLCLNRRDNLQIRLGQPDSLLQKVRIAQTAVAAQGGEIARRAAYIDVSCPDQPVWMPRRED